MTYQELTKFIFVFSLILITFHAHSAQVVIISIDGFREDFLYSLDLPALKSNYQNQKPFIKKSLAVLPSITLVNHASMFSGVTPEKHKILWNEWKPELGLIKVPTIFDLAKLKGGKTAMIVGKKKFEHLNKSVDTFVLLEGQSSQAIIDKAISVLSKGDISVSLIHLPETDQMGHQHGWGSKEYIEALKEVDHAIGNFFAWLEKSNQAKSTSVIITSDHGGHEKGHGTDSKEDTIIPWIAKTPFKLVEIKSTVNQVDTAATAAALLGWDVPVEWAWGGKSVFQKREM